MSDQYYPRLCSFVLSKFVSNSQRIQRKISMVFQSLDTWNCSFTTGSDQHILRFTSLQRKDIKKYKALGDTFHCWGLFLFILLPAARQVGVHTKAGSNFGQRTFKTNWPDGLTQCQAGVDRVWLRFYIAQHGAINIQIDYFYPCFILQCSRTLKPRHWECVRQRIEKLQIRCAKFISCGNRRVDLVKCQFVRVSVDKMISSEELHWLPFCSWDWMCKVFSKFKVPFLFYQVSNHEGNHALTSPDSVL